ncbi:MAG TPA: HlyD family efflux transporter periplasmic adaptor subunit [Bacillota bacterium]|nr:HlyD family efflux transporter periplasmic adaptor subunit [Bacillota bacterium]
MTRQLPPIPTSFAVMWRTVRLRVVPPIVLLSLVAVTLALWRRLDGGGIAGIAEGVRSVVSSPQMALVQELKVRPYQWVEAGQPLLTLLPKDPRARLDLLQSDLQIARLKLEPSLADQNALDFERVRVESMRLKQELAVAAVNLQRAENTLRRQAALFTDKLVSEDAYDLAVQERDVYRAEITEKRKTIDAIDARLAILRPLGEPELPGSNAPLRTVVARLEEKLLEREADWCPLTLVAPISGMVQVVTHQPGEFVTEGEPLITINAGKSDRIVGYLRQPYTLEPQVGMTVEVVTRTYQRQRFIAQVSQIGAQVEVITNTLAFVRPGVLVDAGLPIVVAVPPEVSIRPGEAVDILFVSSSAKSPAVSRAWSQRRSL